MNTKDKNFIFGCGNKAMNLGIFTDDLYWKLQNPKITQVYDKEIVLENLYYDLKDSDIEKEKYALPFILPNIENGINLAHPMYQECIKIRN